MKESMLPQPGTTLSVEWTESGPLFTIRGTALGLAMSLAILAGDISKTTGIPIKKLTDSAREVGVGLYEAVIDGAVTVDLSEAARQAAQMKKEGGECGSES